MIHRRGTEDTEKSDGVVTRRIIGAAVEVHRTLGPGLLESVYQRCLCHELCLQGMECHREVPIPLGYKGLILRGSLRVDLIVAKSVIVEVKATAVLHPIHKAQVLTYLRLLHLRTGLLINLNVERLVNGVRRLVNGY